MDIQGALPKIYTNLLLQSPEILGLLITGNSEEEKIRIMEAYIAKMLHPL